MKGEVKFNFKSRDIQEALRYAVKQALIAVGVEGAKLAKARVPVITGRLRASIGPTAALPTGDYSYLGRTFTPVFFLGHRSGKEARGGYSAVGFKNIRWKAEDWERMGAYRERGLKAYIIVGTNVHYAKAVEFGTTGGRVIRPVRKKALHFFVVDKDTGEEKEIFAKKVVTKPRPAHPFLHPAMKHLEARALNLAQRVFNRSFNKKLSRQVGNAEK